MVNKEELVQTVKGIVKLWRDGKIDEAFVGYRDLFSRPDFMEHRPEDQRSALRLMILVKNAPDPERPTPKMVEAHQAAVASLTELVSRYSEPGDHEMLGISLIVLGDSKKAAVVFRQGLNIERERNPQSDLCGALMKRISLI